MISNRGSYAFSYLEVMENNSDIDRNETLGQFIKSRGYSELFQKAYIVRLTSISCTLGGLNTLFIFLIVILL